MANKQHAQFSDENGNLFYLENQTEDVLDPSGKPLSDGGDLSEASVKFSVDTSRKLPQSGGRFKAFLGSIVKYLTDLGAAAYLAVANNDTTTQPGFVGDARVLKQHRDAINQLNSEINSIGKLLWSGSFTSGSITVPGLSNYSYVIVNVGGVSCFGSPEYGGNVIGGYASYGFGYRSYRFSVNGDKLTIDDINKGGSDGTGNVEVRNIIGLIPKISA